MLRILAMAALIGFGAPLLTPTTALAICECYQKGRLLRCEPSLAACRAEGGDYCDDSLGCRSEGGGEVMLWVNHVILARATNFCFFPRNGHLAAPH